MYIRVCVCFLNIFIFNIWLPKQENIWRGEKKVLSLWKSWTSLQLEEKLVIVENITEKATCPLCDLK